MKKILVIKLGALGDFFAAVSAFEKIRQHHPNDHITLLTTSPYQKIGQQIGYFNEILIDSRPKLTHPRQVWNLRKQLQREKFQRVYDLQMVDRTNFYYQLIRMGFRKKPEWVGTAWGASHPYTLPETPAYHQERLAGLLAAGGIAPPLPLPNLTHLAGDITRFSIKSPYVLFVPGASAQHREKKCWPQEHYAEILKWVAAAGFTPVIIGGADENNHSLTDHCPESLDLTGKTQIRDVITLSTYAAFAIGNDTGPMHIAAACQCPVVVLFFGDSNPDAVGPRGIFYRHIQAPHKLKLKPEALLEILPAFIGRYKASPRH